MKIRKGFLIVFFSIFISVIHTYCQDNATEFGVADDLIVLGVSGTYDDPDVEIKGFTVFGTTQSAYTANIPYGPGNVIINGVLGVSSGAYVAGTSTFAYVSSITISGAEAIFINNGSPGQILRKKLTGELEWVNSNILGDNLGNHIATMTIIANYGINASTISVSTINATGYVNATKYLVNNSTMVQILPGVDSISYGIHAGTSNLGDFNVFIGNYAGTSNTYGSNNIALGYYALKSNTTGGNNIAIGPSALENNISGSVNIAIGQNALKNPIDASNNIAIGYSTLQDNTTGGDNIAIGNYVLNQNKTGSGNVSIGVFSLNNNINGNNNTAIGRMALQENISGDNNTAVGLYALNKNLSSGNTATGAYSLKENTTGENNTAYGAYSLASNTTGSNNTAVGITSLEKNITGNENSALGYRSLANNTIGQKNVAVGSDSLQQNTTGSNNTALGNNSMLYNTVGSGNTAVGSFSLYNNQNGSGNSIFGFKAGYSLTSGSNNILLGYQSGYNITTGNGNIIIGYNINVPAPEINNYLSIGNLIFARGGFGEGTTIGDGSVGIATNDPNGFFQVGSNEFIVSKDGNVGIGTTFPLAKLEVHGESNFPNNLDDQPIIKIVSDAQAVLGFNVQGTTAYFKGDEQGNFAFGGQNAVIFETGGFGWQYERMRITHDGNVGIGTSNPQEKLEVSGNIRFSGALMPGGSAGSSGQILVSQGAGIKTCSSTTKNFK
ncbi:MAG: hypothetical protein QXP04_03175 [Candidatus Nanoarchaeia archaeon]|nr:hypothetical protein [Candidatus Jingweiarchaeum tengchongense]